MNLISQSPGVAIINPKPILDMNYAFAQTALLTAAVRLHIFTYLANDPLTAASLAALGKARTVPPLTRLLWRKQSLNINSG
jgi:hypothetical protein